MSLIVSVRHYASFKQGQISAVVYSKGVAEIFPHSTPADDTYVTFQIPCIYSYLFYISCMIEFSQITVMIVAN